MRRTAILTVFLASALWGTLIGLAPSASAAGTITVPPQVNATTFTQGTIPSSGTGTQNLLDAVSCTQSNFCVATGTIQGGASGLIEQWNGTAWSVVSNPSPAAADLRGVSCVGTSFCVTVGTANSGLVADQWNGTAWSAGTPPAPASTTSSEFDAVTCTSSTNCVAVGDVSTSTSTTPLIEQYNGTAWTIATAPVPTGSTSATLEAVSCSGAAFCIATGENTVTDTTTLIEVWNGASWSIVSSPNGSTATGSSNSLVGVSCIGTAFCQAVGSFDDGTNPNRTLIEQWNGSVWTVVTSPNASDSEGDGLSAVDCFSPTTCSAVGETSATVGAFVPTAAVWNGTTWSAATAPALAPGAAQTEASGVSCLTDWQCVAVGATNASGDIVPYVMTAPIARSGYRFVASDGGVFDYGNGAPFLGSTGSLKLNKPIVGMAVMPAGDGYDLVASDGGIFNYGSAPFLGSAGSIHLNQPIVGMAMTPDGGGYWLVATDGGIFSYGDAQFYGSTGSIKLNKPIVGMAATPDGKGYYLVASDGGIFNYGDAAFQGSAGSLPLNKPVVGMTAPLGGGYYLVASDGGIFSYPTTNGPAFYGSTGSIKLNKPIVGMAAVQGGYYLSATDGGIFAFPTTNGPPFLGSTGSITLNQPIVGMTA
jgi:hypothetical protein